MLLATLTLTLNLILAQDSPPAESLYESATRTRGGSRQTPSPATATPKPSPTASPSDSADRTELPTPLNPKNDPDSHARPVDFGDSSR